MRPTPETTMPTLLNEPPLIPRSLETRTAIAEQLDPLLQCITEIRFAARTAHWNVRSDGFAGVHELFDRIDETFGKHLDEIGERLKVLGGMPSLSMRAMGAMPMYEEMPLSNNMHELVGAMIERIMIHDAYVNYGARVVERIADLATMDMLIKHSGTIQNLLYLLGQHIPSDVLARASAGAQQSIKAMPRGFDKAKPVPMPNKDEAATAANASTDENANKDTSTSA